MKMTTLFISVMVLQVQFPCLSRLIKHSKTQSIFKQLRNWESVSGNMGFWEKDMDFVMVYVATPIS